MNDLTLANVEQVASKLVEALDLAVRIEHSDMLRYLIEAAIIEAREDYFRRLPVDHPDWRPPAP